MAARVAWTTGTALVALLAASQAQGQIAVSRQELTYEIANTYRILADDQFLNGHKTEARTNYGKATDMAAKLRPELGLVTDDDANLLKAEILYRQRLMDYGASFWGFEHQMRPINPVAAWQQFSASQLAFDTEVQKIDGLVAQLYAGTNKQVDDEQDVLRAQEDQAVSTLNTQAAETDLRNAELRRNMLDQRIGAISQRQAALAAERDSLLEQMDQAAAGLDKMMLEAASSAVGLPPNATDLVAGAAKGDVTASLNAAVQAYASSSGADFSGTLGEIAVNAQDAAKEYVRLKALYTDVQARANQGAQLLRAVQSGDTGRILEAGTTVYQNLPPATRQQVESALASNRTIQAAITLARQGTELRAAVAGYVAQAPQLSGLVRPILSQYLDTGSEAFDGYYAIALQAAISTASDVAAQQNNLVRLSRAWAVTIVDEGLGDPPTMIAVAAALGSPCRDAAACRAWLIGQLQARGLTGAPVRVSAAGLVQIVSPGNGAVIRQFDMVAIAQASLKRPVDAQRLALRRDADDLLLQIDAAQGVAAKKILAALPDLDFDRKIAPLLLGLDNSQAEAAVQAIAPAGGNGGDVLTRTAARFALGRDLAQKTVFRDTPSPPAPALAPSGASPGEQAALAAMSAAGPYGMAAAFAIKALAGMEEMSNLAERADRLDKEDRSLTVELMHLAPMKVEVDHDEALATLAKRVAQARNNGASQRGALMQNALQRQGQQANAIEEKIRSRLPLTYYLSEVMREQYDRLDQSLLVWSGQTGPQGHRIESFLRDDPRTARLALDPDIKLYDWFARSSEGQRQDLDRLARHWAQLGAVATQACASLGCAANIAEVGWVDNTPPIALADLASTIPPPGAPRKATFTLLPRHIPDLTQLDNLRLVTVTAAIRNRMNGQVSSPVNVRLQHSGLGYLLVGGEGAREVLEPSNEAPLDFLADDAAISTRRTGLQKRWLSGVGLQPWEGYPLFGLYQVNLPASFDATRQSLELTFFYQWPKTVTPIDARLQQMILACGQGQSATGLDVNEVRLLVRRDDNGVLDRIDPAGPCSIAENAP